MADDEDDPQLGALRAAWRAMPDEDPPERGLAELMAAARAKAEELARPPWWRRALAQLRRPPVLALASVMVLLGGVLVVGHRRDEVESTATAPQGEPATGEAPAPAGAASSVTAPPAAATAPAPSVTGAPTTPASPPLAPAKDKDQTEVPAHHAFPLRAHPPNHPLREAMPPPAALGGAPNGAFARPPGEDTSGAGRGPAPAPPVEHKADEAPAAAADDDEGAGAPAADVSAAPPPPPPAATTAPTPAAPAPAPASSSSASLAAQCRSAAARGDCATARSLAAQIQRDDPTAYAQLQRDATVAACLR